MTNSTSVSPARVAKPIVSDCKDAKTPEEFAALVASSITVSVEAGSVGPAGPSGSAGADGADADQVQFTCNSYPVGNGLDRVIITGDKRGCYCQLVYNQDVTTTPADLTIAVTSLVLDTTGLTTSVYLSAVVPDEFYSLHVFCPSC